MKATRLIIAGTMLVLAASGSIANVAAADEPEANVNQRFVFVVNRIDAGPVALASATDALARFAERNLKAGDQAMVVEIGYSTRVLQELGSDREATVALLRGITPQSVDAPVRVATRQFYDSLRELGDSLVDVPGHKHLILASNEPNRIRSGRLYIDGTVAALNRGNASVHAIDLGLFHQNFLRRGVSGLSPLATETGGVYYHTQSRLSFAAALDRLETQLVAADG